MVGDLLILFMFCVCLLCCCLPDWFVVFVLCFIVVSFACCWRVCFLCDMC